MSHGKKNDRFMESSGNEQCKVTNLWRRYEYRFGRKHVPQSLRKFHLEALEMSKK